MVKKTIIFIAIIIILGIAYWLISPLWRVEKVSEEIPVPTTSEEISFMRQGNFVGFDSIHTGSGTVQIIYFDGKYSLRFEDNFSVANGPDLFVGFGNDGKYDKNSQLAPLKGNVGSQNYELPENFDPSQYDEVWIWCRAFSVPFARAVLTK